MADALVTQLARALHLPPDAAQQTLHHLVSTLREQIEATGEAAVPGLGVFRRSGARLAFEPEEALVRAVNHRYAGLAPVEAAPTSSRSAPTDKADTSPVGFQPLPSLVDDEPADDLVPPEEADDAASEAEVSVETEPQAPPETPEEPVLDDPAVDESPLLDDVVAPEPLSDVDPEEAEPAPETEEPAAIEEDETLEVEAELPDEKEHDVDEDSLDVEEEVESEEGITFNDLSDLDTDDEDELGDEAFDDESGSLDELLAGTWKDRGDASETETHPLGAMPEEPIEEAEYAVVEPEDEEDAVPMVAAAVENLEPEFAEDPELTAAAPVATAALGSRDRESADKRPNRGPLIAGLVVGTLLAVAFLFWVRNQDPAPPPVTEVPPVADTVAATPPPVDTSAAALTDEPVVEPPSADPLRSSAAVDPADGGFTWVVGSELNQAAAERRVERYREQGFRAGVVSQEAAGRTRYRVSLGQFDTIAEAEARRSDLPDDVPSDSWILRF